MKRFTNHSSRITSLPTRLRHPWYVSFERQLAEANSAKREFTQITAAATASPASIVYPRSENVQVHPCRFGALHRFLVCLALLLLDSLLCICQGSLKLVGFMRRRNSRHIPSVFVSLVAPLTIRYFVNGIPNSLSKALPSSSVLAVVTIDTFSPLVRSTLLKSISGKIN